MIKGNMRIKVRLERKMLQKKKNITELLNVCYNSINRLDIMEKNDKIVLCKKGKI